MSRPRPILTVSYQVLDPSGKCLEVIKESGLNRNYIQWIVERRVAKKYGKDKKIHAFKIVEETL